MIRLREAVAADASAIREIFLDCYGKDYPYPQYYDVENLVKLVYSDDTLLLVAEDAACGRVVGTASVILEVGAYSDLVGEFGRLAVRHDARHGGIGARLMEERLDRVRHRLHLGLIEGRIAHPFTQRIAESHGFAAVGYLPSKMALRNRESLVLMIQHFGEALELRNNHPRIIPEVFPLAELAMEHCGLRPDAIVDDSAAPYPHAEGFDVEELTTQGYASLLRIERGRVRHREIYGPMRLHYGFFKLAAKQSRYLLARQEGRVVGAIGFSIDPLDSAARVFEMIALDDPVVRFLFQQFIRSCREKWDMKYLEVDVSADSPRMQRTLLELGFVPAGYVPALVFQEVERLDVVKMIQLLGPLEPEETFPSSRTKQLADLVLGALASRAILPQVAEAMNHVQLFAELTEEQRTRLAGAFSRRVIAPGVRLFNTGDPANELYVLLSGKVDIHYPDAARPVGHVTRGECLGEVSFLTGGMRLASAEAASQVEAAVLTQADLRNLVRRRPDIGVMIYRNLAIGLGEKLHRSNIAQRSSTE